jgi:hypothetical protein
VPGAPANEGTPGASDGTLVASGSFRDGDPGHNGKGTVRILRDADGKAVVRFEGFSVTGGPDLFVYLVEQPDPSRSEAERGLNIGDLKATDGNQNYEVPPGTDLEKYRSVVIWCRQFRVIFALATLEPAGAGGNVQAQQSGGSATPPTVNASAQAPAGTATSTPTTQGATPRPAGTSTTTPPPGQPSATATAVPPTPTAAPQSATPTPASANPRILAAGTFRDGDPGHNGRGIARLGTTADGQVVLRFENFSVTGGPDLVVILSTDPGGSRGSVSSGLNLGALKATDGNQNYTVPAGTDVSKFRSVIIYCKSFPTVFAYATLEVQ